MLHKILKWIVEKFDLGLFGKLAPCPQFFFLENIKIQIESLKFSKHARTRVLKNKDKSLQDFCNLLPMRCCQLLLTNNIPLSQGPQPTFLFTKSDIFIKNTNKTYIHLLHTLRNMYHYYPKNKKPTNNKTICKPTNQLQRKT